MVATWGEPAAELPTTSMRQDLLRRVRWGNVTLTGALLVMLVFTLRAALGPAPVPHLPPDRPAPLTDDPARPEIATEPSAESRAETKTPRNRRHRTNRTAKRPARARRPARVT